MQDRKMWDWKMQDQNAELETAGPENAGLITEWSRQTVDLVSPVNSSYVIAFGNISRKWATKVG